MWMGTKLELGRRKKGEEEFEKLRESWGVFICGEHIHFFTFSLPFALLCIHIFFPLPNGLSCLGEEERNNAV